MCECASLCERERGERERERGGERETEREKEERERPTDNSVFCAGQEFLDIFHSL